MIAMLMQWPGVTKEQYEQARKIVNWEGDPAPGGLIHIASFDKNGLRVTDVWQTAEQFNHFVEHRLMPGVAQVGVQGQPSVEILPVHEVFTPAYIAKEVLETV